MADGTEAGETRRCALADLGRDAAVERFVDRDSFPATSVRLPAEAQPATSRAQSSPACWQRPDFWISGTTRLRTWVLELNRMSKRALPKLIPSPSMGDGQDGGASVNRRSHPPPGCAGSLPPSAFILARS